MHTSISATVNGRQALEQSAVLTGVLFDLAGACRVEGLVEVSFQLGVAKVHVFQLRNSNSFADAVAAAEMP
jgi:hypothetical protein